MTSSLGSGRNDDSTAMRATMPGYPIPRNRSSSHWMNDSSIEAVLPHERNKPRRSEGGVAHIGSPPDPLHQRQHLRAPLAERDQQSPARGELLDERRGNLWAP